MAEFTESLPDVLTNSVPFPEAQKSPINEGQSGFFARR